MIAALRREPGLTLLAAALVVQIAILVVTRLPGRVEAPEPLLAGFTVEAATRIEIDDSTGVSVVLARAEAGWMLPDAGAYPADGTRVAGLLGHLAAARRDRPVVRTQAGQRELRVVPDAFERRMQVHAGEVEHLLYIGTSAGTRSAHVRVDGQNEVWSVAELAPWQVPADVSSWIDPLYLRVEPDRVAAFELVNAAGSFRFERAEDGWTVAGLQAAEALDQERVSAFVDRLSTLRMRRPLGTELLDRYRLDPPAAVVRLTLSAGQGEGEDEDEAGVTVQLTVGAADTAGDAYVVKSSESEYYVEVSSFTLSDLVDADRSTFVIADDTAG